MKKLLLSLLTIMLVALFVSCSKEEAANAADGFNAGYEGFTYIGTYDSASECSDACEYLGYSYYRYNFDLNNCYCK